MDAESRAAVWRRADRRCENCHMSAEVWDQYTFHIEHIYAKKHGGSDDPQNLCLSCPECNWSKGVNLSGLVGDKIVPLFHPRRQAWDRHFAWDGPMLVGKTFCGKATISVLNINEPSRVEIRRMLMEVE
jgi:hypothetical protein